MASKFLLLVFGIGLTICVAEVQSQLLTGTPAGSLSSPKHRTQKETEAASPAESATPPSPAASPRLRRRRNVFAERQRLKHLPVPVPRPLQSRHRRLANSSSGSHVCSNRSSLPLHRREFSAGKWRRRCGIANAAPWRSYAHPGPCSVSSTAAYHRRLAQPPLHTARPYFPDATPGRTGRRTIGHRGFSRAMEAWLPTPADGLQRDRFFQLALACRRSLADTQPGTLTQ